MSSKDCEQLRAKADELCRLFVQADTEFRDYVLEFVCAKPGHSPTLDPKRWDALERARNKVDKRWLESLDEYVKRCVKQG